MKGKSGIQTRVGQGARFRFCKSGKPGQPSEKINYCTLENSWTPTTIQIAHATCSGERSCLAQWSISHVPLCCSGGAGQGGILFRSLVSWFQPKPSPNVKAYDYCCFVIFCVSPSFRLDIRVDDGRWGHNMSLAVIKTKVAGGANWE